MKCDVIDGSVVNSLRQPILYSFVLNKKPGYKVFSEPETIHYKKLNKPVLNIITFYLEDETNEEVNFNGETLTFTLQMIKNYYNWFTHNYLYNKQHSIFLKETVTVLEADIDLIQKIFMVI